jgi:lactaldehyde dehydrogenase
MRMLIDGEWCEASDGSRISVTDPATGRLIDDVPAATVEDVARAIAAAQVGRIEMAAMPAHARAAALARTADELDVRREELAALLAAENGKPIRQTREEVAAAARIFRGFGEEAKRLFGRQIPLDAVPGLERHMAITIRQPIGVVAAIVPFNYPVELYAHKAAAALAAGDAVIGKPPSDCPLALLEVAGILQRSGLPRAAHQMISGPGERIGPLLAASDGVQLVTVTGSVETGAELGRIAAEHMKPFHAELGGNDASIVCADADLEKAAEAIVLGRLARGNGQICCSVKRVFVDRRVVDDFAAILGARAAALSMGSQLEESCDVGPLISEAAAQRVIARVDAAVAAGAVLVAGGHREGAFVEPTVLIGVAPDEALFCEETFGPVVPIVAFDTIEEAVSMANDSRYGLQAAVFTRDIGTAMWVAHRLEAGGVIVNWSSALRAENLPFGGLKWSGHGREGLHDTLLAMTEQKVILLHDVLATPSAVLSPPT